MLVYSGKREKPEFRQGVVVFVCMVMNVYVSVFPFLTLFECIFFINYTKS